MAQVLAKAVYTFHADDPSELSFEDQELLVILRQDVGDGWWEAKNERGQTGLIPEAYVEITSMPEPSIPPPPPPSFQPPPQPAFQLPPANHMNRNSFTQQAPPPKPSAPPMAPPPAMAPPTMAPPPSNNGWSQPASSLPKQDSYDDWDDDDWDDDDSSTTTETPSEFGGHGRDRTGSSSDDKHKFGTVSKSRFGKFSNFSKQGGEAYLFDVSTRNIPDSEKMAVVMESNEGPCWKRSADIYTCAIRSPKKESKFHGMKSFIAYQLTPTFSNIQVSRRYKHFDWLHDRLVDKFSCCAIPPLPEKQVAGRFEEDFITGRLRLLQLWVDRMCQHPVVSHSEVFLHFMSCTDEKKWKTGKRKAEKDEYQGIKFFLAVQTPPHTLDAKTTENQIDRFGRFVKSMDDSVRHFLTVGENNVKKHQGPFKKEFCKLGGSFIALAKSFEYDERPIAQPLTAAIENTGRTYEEIGKSFERQPHHDMSNLLEGLQEYKGLLSTFPDAISVHRAATNKIQESAGKFSESEMTSVQGRADVIAYAVMAEMGHFQQYRVGDFKGYMQGYLQGQIEFYKSIVQKLENSLAQYDSC